MIAKLKGGNRKDIIDLVIDCSIIQQKDQSNQTQDEIDRLFTWFARLINILVDEGILDKDKLQSILKHNCKIEELTKY